jgi:hypothetical protein
LCNKSSLRFCFLFNPLQRNLSEEHSIKSFSNRLHVYVLLYTYYTTVWIKYPCFILPTYLLNHYYLKLIPPGPSEYNTCSTSQKITCLYGSKSFITVYTGAHHWSLPWAKLIQSTPSHLICSRLILKSSYHLDLGLPGLPFRLSDQELLKICLT